MTTTESAVIYTATIKLDQPNPDTGKSELYYVSLDGEVYLGVTRLPIGLSEREAVEALFDGDTQIKPMTFGRRFLHGLAAQEEVDTILWDVIER